MRGTNATAEYTYDSPGDVVGPVPAPYAVLRGNPIQLRQLFGFALNDAAIGEDVMVGTSGVWWVAIKATQTPDFGMPLHYVDDATAQEKLELTTTQAGATKYAGVALSDVVGDGVTRNCLVRLHNERT